MVNTGKAAKIFPSASTSFLEGQGYGSFQLPTSLLLAASFGTAALFLVEDIEGGYFDKLRATPIPRTAIGSDVSSPSSRMEPDPARLCRCRRPGCADDLAKRTSHPAVRLTHGGVPGDPSARSLAMSLTPLAPGQTSSLMPGLDHDVVGWLTKTHDDQFGDGGAKEVRWPFRCSLALDDRDELRVGDLLDAAG